MSKEVQVHPRPVATRAVYLESQRHLKVGDHVRVYWGGISANGTPRTTHGRIVAMKTDGRFTVAREGRRNAHSHINALVSINGQSATEMDRIRWGDKR